MFVVQLQRQAIGGGREEGFSTFEEIYNVSFYIVEEVEPRSLDQSRHREMVAIFILRLILEEKPNIY